MRKEKLLTASQASALDRAVIQSGPSSPQLMRAAAQAFVEELDRAFPEALLGPAAVLFHHGKNGGDGVEAGRLLLARGHTVRFLFTGQTEKIAPETAEMLEDLRRQGGLIEPFQPENSVQRRFVTEEAALLIDAMFGVGFHGELSGSVLTAAQWMNQARGVVAAVDLPSGIDADTGAVCSGAVRAALTVTFGTGKVGQFVQPGRSHCGRLIVRSIGFPQELIDAADFQTFRVTKEWCAGVLGALPNQGHKGTFGRTLLFSGSVGMSGAASFAARGALLSGAGTVTLVSPEENYSVLGALVPEAMQLPQKSTENCLTPDTAESVEPELSRMQAVLFGPGIGRAKGVSQLLLWLLKKWEGPLVLDADGLFAVQSHKDMLRSCSGPLILTPHDGEFSRLSDALSHMDRPAAARALAKETGAIVVLKGPNTLIAAPDGRLGVNETGGVGLATGGTGDILAGMITGLLGRGMDPFRAACCAVWAHGRAGDLAQQEGAWFSVTASSVLSKLPLAYGEITQPLRQN